MYYDNIDRSTTLNALVTCLSKCKIYRYPSSACRGRILHGYLTRRESDGVLHQMTWPPQSPHLNSIETVWDELDRRVKEKQSTSAQYTVGGNSFKTVGKAFQVKLVDRMSRECKTVIKASKGGYFEESLKYI
jgi:hypothetical protein